MGYRHSPQGAVLAAIRGQVHLGMASDSEWGRTVALVSAPGPGREEFAAQRVVLSISGSVPAGAAPKYVAFKVSHYSDTAAAVHIVTEIGAPTQTFDYPVALSWIDNDWRIVLPTSAEAIDATEVTSLDGYTRLEGS
ncbi:hypothetical protein [Nocardia sp. NPDC060249]|uniref:hypothetical protein n=1 Tax=Nocardia sp. NPDC060249 TaxID=3347082 RepID=UPI00364A18A7